LARVPVSKTGGWGFESLLPCEYGPVHAGRRRRQPTGIVAQVRTLATQTRGPAPERAAKPNRPAKADRTSPAQFVREVRDELRKVVWPTRKELVTYTTVALVFILVMVGIVTSLDYGFTKLVLALFG
jgi:preprotein translocase subunit SecE